MAELYDKDTCCDYPTVNFYGAAQNADVATAEIALGYGMLGTVIVMFAFLAFRIQRDAHVYGALEVYGHA